MNDIKFINSDILRSRRFRKLSADAQALYLFLAANADQNGYVEANKVMIKHNSSLNDLRRLIASGLLQMIEEEGCLIRLEEATLYIY